LAPRNFAFSRILEMPKSKQAVVVFQHSTTRQKGVEQKEFENVQTQVLLLLTTTKTATKNFPPKNLKCFFSVSK
jgi:hypothetical protein